MAYFDNLTAGMTYDKLLAEYSARKAQIDEETAKLGYQKTPYNSTLIASDGQHYNLLMPQETDGGFVAGREGITFDRGTNNGNNNVSYSPDQQNGYVYKDDDSFGGFLANGLKYVGAPLLAAYGMTNLLGAGAAGTGDVAAMGMDQVGAMGLPEASSMGLGSGIESSIGSAGLSSSGVTNALSGIANGAALPAGLGVAGTGGALAGFGGLLDAVGGVKGALTIGGGLLGAASAKDGTQTQTKEPWAPMQPYLLDNANNIKNWYAQNGNGGVEANRLAAQIPAFNQQQAQAGQGLLSMANQYAKRKGL